MILAKKRIKKCKYRLSSQFLFNINEKKQYNRRNLLETVISVVKESIR